MLQDRLNLPLKDFEEIGCLSPHCFGCGERVEANDRKPCSVEPLIYTDTVFNYRWPNPSGQLAGECSPHKK